MSHKNQYFFIFIYLFNSKNAEPLFAPDLFFSFCVLHECTFPKKNTCPFKLFVTVSAQKIAPAIEIAPLFN